jgi:hypothetical protein
MQIAFRSRKETNSGNYRIVQFDAIYQSIWTQLYCPCGIVVDLDDNVVVVDRYNHHIQKFSKDVNRTPTIGNQESDQCEFKFPYTVAVCKTDERFFGNIERHRIQELSPDGNFLFKFGLEACENGQFQYGSELVSSNWGQYMFSCDFNKYHIQKFNALNGNFIKSYASNGVQCNYPFGIFTSLYGQTIISEAEYA